VATTGSALSTGGVLVEVAVLPDPGGATVAALELPLAPEPLAA